MGSGNFTHMPIAPYPDHRNRHLLKGSQGFLSLRFLHIAQDGIQNDDCQDDDSINIFVQENGDKRRNKENEDHHAFELVQQDLPPGLLPFIHQFIQAILFQPFFGFLLGQALCIISL